MNANDPREATPPIVVGVLDADGWRLAGCADEDLALTLFAVASEDPANWQEIAAYWPRYRTPVVAEFADGTPLFPADDSTVRCALAQTGRWLVIDLVRKRITSGKDFNAVGRDQVFAMEVDEKGDQHWPLSIHLPPWWELNEQAAIDAIDDPRMQPILRPRPNREVLFGEPMIDDLAARILHVSRSGRWRDSGAADDPQHRYPFTIEVHRDWLMTPRADLDGRMPREMLHGAIGWIDHLEWAQHLRFEDCGLMIAAPTEVCGYDVAPMAREEVCIYFDLCREIIGAGWHWCSESNENDGDDLSALKNFLADVKTGWLGESFEGGSPPRFILECSRRRVPRGSGVAIVGMDGRESEQHVPDCDCPICEMIADGSFGVGFTGIDGHHLDLDNEFAFSLCETRAEWEEQQRDHEEFAAEMDRKRAQREGGDSEAEADEFSSAWNGMVSDEPLPGDAGGHLKLAFLLAEIVGVLDSLDVFRDEIAELNRRFRQFRKADVDSRTSSATRLQQYLDEVVSKVPDLVSRAADFQSRIDESLRQASNLSDEFPF
jgi:hypothetical protein